MCGVEALDYVNVRAHQSCSFHCQFLIIFLHLTVTPFFILIEKKYIVHDAKFVFYRYLFLHIKKSNFYLFKKKKFALLFTILTVIYTTIFKLIINCFGPQSKSLGRRLTVTDSIRHVP